MACDEFHLMRRRSRRDILCAGSLAPVGLTLPGLLAAEAAGGARATADSVILLYQWGGPSHLETFDMKPDGPEESRGQFRPIRSSADGIQVCELLPRFAQVMDRCSLVRSVTHRFRNHNPPGYYGLTGHAPPLDDQRLRDTPDLFPHCGSVIQKLRPPLKEVPGFVAMPASIKDGSVVPGQHASFLGKNYDPLLILQDPNAPDFRLPELSLPEGVSLDRLQERRSLLELLDGRTATLRRQAAAGALDRFNDRAFSLLSSSAVREAFDLTREPSALRDAYGRTTFGQCVLLARRLVERGVRIVTCYYCRPSGGFIWDTHKENFPELKNTLLPTTDQTVPTLLADLEARGLLDRTLVVWMGEFGRTPKINKDAGRDHWPQCYTALFAGGGVKRGFVYGRSDAAGAYPDEDPVKPDHLIGSIYHALGIDPHTEVRDRQNRPLPLAGEPIRALFA